MKIVYWGKYIDSCLLDTLTPFQELAGEPIHYVLVEKTFTHRQVEGRQLVDPSVNPLTLLSRHGFAEKSMDILEENHAAIHIFLSFWGDKRLFGVLLRALWRKHKVAVIFEPYSTAPHAYWKEEGRLSSHLKVLGRHVAYRMLWPIMRLASRDKMPCILAVSPLAEEQLHRVGFPAEVVYTFGYFVERKVVEHEQKDKEEVLRILFSGSLIMRKGLDIAIAAVQRVNSANVKVLLDIYGPGEISKFLKNHLPGICYKGVYPQGDGQRLITAYDLLLVPSRHDGWGQVVNEALMQGVPVVVSDRVGAKCIVEKTGAGVVFKSEDVNDLVNLLKKLALTPSLVDDLKKHAAQVEKLILPEVAAKYLYDVFINYFGCSQGHRPDAIWCDDEMVKKNIYGSFLKNNELR